jgi:PAS domain S-box-containing protein
LKTAVFQPGETVNSAEAFSNIVAPSGYEALLLMDQAILEAIPNATYVCSAAGVIVRFNRRVADIWGRLPEAGDPQQLYGGAARLYDPDGTPLDGNTPMEVALRSGEPQRDREIVIERWDGSRIAALVNVEPLFDRTGRIEGAINCVQDITARRVALREADLRRRNEQAAQHLAAIVESSDDAIVSKNLEGVIETWNRGAERLFGYAAGEIVGKSVLTLIPEELRSEEPQIIDRISRGERIEHFETRRLRKDGSLVDISLTISPVRDADGRIVGASKIARDISDRKRAEAALARHMQEQTALYRLTERLHRAQSLDEIHCAALDAIIDALGCSRASILEFDETEVMRFVAWRGLSQTYRRAVDGHSPWTPSTVDPQAIFIEDVAAADLPEALKATIAAEGIGALAFIPLLNGGRVIGKFMAYYDQPRSFGAGDVGLAVTIARQLGFSIWRMAAEAERRESEQRLQMALEAGRMGAWEWDIDTGKVVWSPGLQELHGLQPGTFGGTFEDFKRDVHPQDLPMVEEKVRQALGEMDDYHVIYRVNHPSASVRWFEAFGRFMPRSDGRPRRMAGVCMDITSRKQAEAQRDLLVAELSHRVKNTLATVVSIARQSFSTNPDAKAAERSFNARIRALGQTHSRLAEASWSGVSLETILADELAPYRREDGANTRLSGPAVTLTPKQALTLGMAIHELATNAAKYGALSTRNGVVDVGWSIDNRELGLCWSESGGPPVVPPTHHGFGRLLVERVLASDLDGRVDLDFASGGLNCTIVMPLHPSGH